MKSYEDKIKSPVDFQNKNSLFIFYYTTLTRTTVNFVYVPHSKDFENSEPKENLIIFHFSYVLSLMSVWFDGSISACVFSLVSN